MEAWKIKLKKKTHTHIASGRKINTNGNVCAGVDRFDIIHIAKWAAGDPKQCVCVCVCRSAQYIIMSRMMCSYKHISSCVCFSAHTFVLCSSHATSLYIYYILSYFLGRGLCCCSICQFQRTLVVVRIYFIFAIRSFMDWCQVRVIHMPFTRLRAIYSRSPTAAALYLFSLSSEFSWKFFGANTLYFEF